MIIITATIVTFLNREHLIVRCILRQGLETHNLAYYDLRANPLLNFSGVRGSDASMASGPRELIRYQFPMERLSSPL